MARFYITTSIMYTNGRPHIGFALELLQADALARWRRMKGDEVAFLTGTDEHGTKIARAAAEAGAEPQTFVDVVAEQVRDLAKKLDISNTDFIRTTDRKRHWPAAQKLWGKLAASGDLYRKTYKGWYCVGHEAFVRENELADGRCPLHKTPAELVSEENWFFRLAKYADDVRELISSGALRIVPETRKQEVLNLLDDADDVSFSRPSAQLSWGIPVPGDPSQTMYVWADALTNYISAPGYAEESEEFRALWPADVHLIGKDILRFHAILWPAMLLSAGLKPPKAVYVHGFINMEGQKMSKSLGNIIDPADMVSRYGAETSRYYLLREIPSTDDGDFSWRNLESRYESDLANGLGNLLQRVEALIVGKPGGKIMLKEGNILRDEGSPYAAIMNDGTYDEAMEQFRLHDACADVWRKIGLLNAFINERRPWKEDTERLLCTMTTVLMSISHLAWLLQPFMPASARQVTARLGLPLDEPIGEEWACEVKKSPPLFPRRG